MFNVQQWLMQKGNVLRRPSVTRGSLGVSPTGTAEPNPTAPAGRIKPRINNGERGHLWLGTKQCLDRNTNGFSGPNGLNSPFTDKSSLLVASASNILRGTANCPFLNGLLGGKPAPGFHFPSTDKQKNISPHSRSVSPRHYSRLSQDLHITAGHNPLLVLLCQTEPSEERGQFELGSGGPGGNAGK